MKQDFRAIKLHNYQHTNKLTGENITHCVILQHLILDAMPKYLPNSRFSDCYASVGNVTFFHRDGEYYEMLNNWIDEKYGLIMSFIPDGDWIGRLPAKGSYSALSCYYLTFVDEVFALSQYHRLKENFHQKRPIAGFKEYYDRKCLLGFDIDAGHDLTKVMKKR